MTEKRMMQELELYLFEYAEAKRRQVEAQAMVDLLKKQLSELLDDLADIRAGKK